MLVTKAICLPSGESVLSLTSCVMYSLSIVNGWTSNFCRDSTLAGSVTTLPGKLAVCATAETAMNSVRSRGALRILLIKLLPVICLPAKLQGVADLCISTVDHVLSAAWQRFSSVHCAHLGLRAMQTARP